ncbi:MAG: ribonucleoside-diphosphate reductase subunit alpha [Gammaproteobacteria bacterium]
MDRHQVIGAGLRHLPHARANGNGEDKAVNVIGGGARREYKVIRRNGAVAPFDANKITAAVSKAFIAKVGAPAASAQSVRDFIAAASAEVLAKLQARNPMSATFHIEAIQDQVELALMRSEYHEVGRAYMLYRAERAKARAETARKILPQEMKTRAADGSIGTLDVHYLQEKTIAACHNLPRTDAARVLRAALNEMYDGISDDEVESALCLSARALIEVEPEYSFVSARLLLDSLRHEVFGHRVGLAQMSALYPEHLRDMIAKGAELLSPQMATKFDLQALGNAIRPERDLQFHYLGLQTLYDRYLLHIGGRRIEMPQTFFMRVAMGLAIGEKDPTARAAEFYELLSSFRFMSSTPTLFNSGTRHSQLSSCYLTTVADDLKNIFLAYQENALLAKFAGGLGNDWTPVRAMGSHIQGTNGKSQGVVPFLKIVNDTAVAVNQGGKRKGAVCAYLETWHLDLPAFLELRKNTGDERRRAHDMNTANWVPDLFMKRVARLEDWTLFSPSDVPGLHDKFGAEFERAYVGYEEKAARGEILSKTIPARDLWRKMLGMLFETGHPWITFKDACNVRSPQQHCGVVHSSNLCTEITLNTNEKEIAVCNLGSVNLHAHLQDGELNEQQLAKTVRTAMRMLDNVIDINYYAVDKAKNSNKRHRPVGLGLMGFQDCLYELGVPYNSDAAVEFADNTMETVCYYAYDASCDLAKERGKYESFDGSLWSRGIMPPDTLRMLAKERGDAESSADLPMEGGRIDSPFLQADISTRRDWNNLRARIKKHGMRNSNCVAIAPTATIANIVGVSASIEPTYQNIYVKSNLSGDFTVSNRYLVRELQDLGLWDEMMLQDIKYYDGRTDQIERIPEEVRARYPTAFDIDPKWLIECAARRQKWIDQAQSLNLYMAQPSGRKLEEMYRLAWLRGLKTTYYLRTLGASSTDKPTTRTGGLNDVPAEAPPANANPNKLCPIDDPTCEGCE